MTFDVAALVCVGVFAIWGAFTGFARQVGQAVAGFVAFVVAAPSGRFFGQAVAEGLLKSSLTAGVVVATVLSFIIVYLVLRLIITAFLRRLMAGRDPQNRTADRAFGFALSGTKAGALVYFGLCAVVFLENNLVIGGRKFAFAPKNSKLGELARQYNVFERVQFGGGRDLLAAAKYATDPKQAAKLKDDPDYAALMKDPRFRQVVQSDAWKKALETGDVRALMQNNQLVELIHDAKMHRHLERLAERTE